MRIRTGVFGLDELIGGGFVNNTVNAILGTTGCGKTIFSLQYIVEGLENGDCCVYISFDLDEEDFLRVAESFGWDLRKYIEEGLLNIRRFYAESVSYLNSDVLSYISDISKRCKVLRIVIDSFTPFVASFDYSARSEVGWFFKNLREAGTSLITLEEPFDGSLSEPNMTIPLFLSDTVIHLKNIGYGEIFNRTLRIVKHRYSWHAEGVFPYQIVEGAGIVIENKRCNGFDAKDVVKNLKISEIAKKKLLKLASDGIITKDDLEKIAKRLT